MQAELEDLRSDIRWLECNLRSEIVELREFLQLLDARVTELEDRVGELEERKDAKHETTC